MKYACTELNTELGKEELPPIKFRISMEYGEVEIAISSTVNYVDLFGHVVNYCSKLNGVASSDNVLLGITLYNIILNKGFTSQYRIEKIDLSTHKDYETLLESVYSISPKHTTHMLSGDYAHELIGSEKIIPHQYPTYIKKGSFNILIIDDDEDILYSFQSILKKEGYKVKIFSNPTQAFMHFMKVEPYRYDLVIMDIRMPNMSGIQLYYRLKAVDPYIDVLLVTALDVVK